MNKIKCFGKNLIICYIMIIVLLFVISAIFAYTNINDKYLDMFVIGIMFISVLINSILLTKKIKSKGIIYGGIFGLISILLLYFIGIVFLGFTFTTTTIIYLGLSFLAGIIGGGVGVSIA